MRAAADVLKCVAGTVQPRKGSGLQAGTAEVAWAMERPLLRLRCAFHSVTAVSSRYWNGVVPERCKLQFKEGEEWNCFFGYKIYPTLRCKYRRRDTKWILSEFPPHLTWSNPFSNSFVFLGPVFVVQWLFDEAQLTVDNVHLTGQPVQEGQWLYIQNLGRELRNTLKDVT